MTTNSAYELVEIEANKDYAPKAVGAPYVGSGPVVNKGMTPPIFALWCVKSTNTGNIVIQPLGNENPVTIPCSAMKEGVVYYIYLKKLLDDNNGAVKFMGYKYKDYPITL